MAGKWTPERVELAKRLWIDGYSAARVARELGVGFTRSSVLGKMMRLGVAGGSGAPRQTTVDCRIRAPKAPKPYIPPPPKPPKDAPPPLGEVRQFVPNGQCKWIHGEIGCAWQMCGQPVHREGSPWCLYHWHKAISKNQEAA